MRWVVLGLDYNILEVQLAFKSHLSLTLHFLFVASGNQKSKTTLRKLIVHLGQEIDADAINLLGIKKNSLAKFQSYVFFTF